MTSLGMHVNSCPEGQFFREQLKKCEDCGIVCHKGLPLAKCPRECLEYLYENAQHMILDLPKKEGRPTCTVTGSWDLNNWSIVFGCIIAGGIIILAVWQIRKNGLRIIRRITGRKKPVDPERGLEVTEHHEEVPLMIEAVPPNAPCTPDVRTTGTQTEKTTVEKETQVDKLPVEEIGHQVEDQPSEPKVESPQPEPTSFETLTEEVLDNDKPKEGLEDLDQEDEGETAVKTPFNEDEATGESVAEISSEDNPKVTLNDNHLDNLTTPQGEQLLAATGGSDH